MVNQNFSFIVLTLNEEQHLPRLLHSIRNLNAATYVLDSGSTDQTLEICRNHQVKVAVHHFDNHPLQWHYALKKFKINTPWVIGLDADQMVSPGLNELLLSFKNEDYKDVNGIYFNRKNFFRGTWIRHGGYFPKYMLKMFRYNQGYSDLNQLMDHRFIVPGNTRIWKSGYLYEENLKENDIDFWIQKHIQYSTLLAREEFMSSHHAKPTSNLWGHPNERLIYLKNQWRKLPLYLRPFLYFGYRMFFQLGILDGKNGIIFHFLQGFWFRLIVDIKIDEYKSEGAKKDWPVVPFLFSFLLVYTLLYGFNLAFIGISSPPNIYSSFIDNHLNYIKLWRICSIHWTQNLLEFLGYQTTSTETSLSVKGHAGFRLIYSCLGYGVMSYFSAFIIALPKTLVSKVLWLSLGLTTIQALNIFRLACIAIYWKNISSNFGLDHHLLFNILIYIVVGIILFCSLSPINQGSHYENTTDKIIR